jgi:hypothetical protein
MKPRKILITMEVRTDALLEKLGENDRWDFRETRIGQGNCTFTEVLKIQAKVKEKS